MRTVMRTGLAAYLMLVLVLRPASGEEFIRLIPSNPVPPLNAPELTRKASGMKSAIQLLSKAGPWYNQKRVREELDNNINSAAEKAFAQVAASGQAGVLLQVQVMSSQTEAGPFYQLRGDGVTFVGLGQNADAVCFIEKCFGDKLGVPVPAGSSLAANYLWMERDASGKFVQSLYSAQALETRANQIYINTAMREAYGQVVKGQAFSGYLGALSKRVKTQEQKNALADLEAKRKKAIERVEKIEEEYARELTRQGMLANAASTMATLQGILSVASMVAQASNAIGEAIGNPKDFQTPEAVTGRLREMAKEAGAKAADIRVKQSNLRDQQGLIESQILQFGVTFDMPVPPGAVLSPKP